MVKYPFAFDYTVSEYQLRDIRDTVNHGYLESETFSVPSASGVHYFLRIYPDGATCGQKGKTWIYLNMLLGNQKNIRATFTFTIKSADFSYVFDHVYEEDRKGWGWWCCYTKELFRSSKNMFFNGKLTVKVEGNMYIEPDPVINYVVVWENFIQTKSIKGLWSNGNEDFVIVAGGKEVKVHKSVLSDHSPVFDAMFNSSMKEAAENRVVISDFTYDIVSLAMTYCYYQAYVRNVSIADALLLLNFVDKYDMANIKLGLEIYLECKTTVENVCQIAAAAIERNSSKLKSKCLDLFSDCLAVKTPVPNMELLDKEFLIAAIKKSTYHKSQTL